MGQFQVKEWVWEWWWRWDSYRQHLKCSPIWSYSKVRIPSLTFPFLPFRFFLYLLNFLSFPSHLTPIFLYLSHSHPFLSFSFLFLFLSFPFSCADILTPSGLCKVVWGTLVRAIPSLTSLLPNQDPQVRTHALYVESLYFSLIHGALWLYIPFTAYKPLPTTLPQVLRTVHSFCQAVINLSVDSATPSSL